MMDSFFNQQQRKPYEQFQENMNIARSFLCVSSIPLLVIFRHGLGKRLFANLSRNFGLFVFFSGGFGILVLLFLMQGFVSQGNPFLLILFLIGTLFLMLWHRTAMLFRRREVYSVSLGESWLWKILPPYSSVQTLLEPAIAAAAGLLISIFNAPLGIFLVWSAISLCFVQFQANQNEREELIQIKDEKIRAKGFEKHLNAPSEDQMPSSRVRIHQPQNNKFSNTDKFGRK